MTKNVKGGLGARRALRPVGGSARLAQNARGETLRGGGGGGGGMVGGGAEIWLYLSAAADL